MLRERHGIFDRGRNRRSSAKEPQERPSIQAHERIITCMPGPRIDLVKAHPLPAPLALYVEPTNVCNFRCPICPESLPDYKQQAGYLQRMAADTFERIIAGIKGWTRLKVMRFFWVGEPLLNPALPKMIIAGAAVADRTEITTNASKLTAAWNSMLIEARLDYLRVSVYGTTDDDYRRETKSFVRYGEILNNVLQLRLQRDIRHEKRPHIYAELVTTQPGQEERFAQQWEHVADSIGIKPLHNWGSYGDGLVQLGSAPPRLKLVCPYPFYELLVKANGDVSPCCADWNGQLSLGNVNRHSIREIWNGPEMAKLRGSHMTGRRMSIPSCKDCNLINTSPDNLDAMVL